MRRNKRIHIIWLLLCFTGVMAQNNPYKIDDSLYELYQRAYRQRTRTQGLQIADTLYREAVRKQDKKAQCLAFVMPITYYFNHNDSQKIGEAVGRMKKEARQTNFLQYYYYAYRSEIIYYLNHGNSLRALRIAEDMKNDAFSDEYPYGILSCMRTLGDIYTIRRNFKLAGEHYEKALNYVLENLPEQDPTSLYMLVGRYYQDVYNNGEKALEYINQAIKSAKTPTILVTAKLERCLLLYKMERFDEFKTYYDNELMSAVRKYDPHLISDLFLNNRIKRLVLDTKYGEAIALADSLPALAERWSTKAYICQQEGDYKAACYYLTRGQAYKDSLDNEMSAADIAELNVQIGNERLQLENAQLNLKNITLQLGRERWRSQQAESQLELARMSSLNDSLTLNNHKLELAHLEMKAEQQKIIFEKEKAASRAQIIILMILGLCLLISIIFLIVYLYIQRKSKQSLRRKNKELEIARDRAEEADKMKSIFIQNMSHEIRTPLNAIVGFSQLILTPEMELGEDEKKEFGELIQHNSDLLTTLINDILNLAELESGKYTMKIKEHCCNELCHMAIATVAHRRPENVEFYFTSEVEDDYIILTDGHRVRQVLINFLTNAEKHTIEGEIHLHCSLSENPGKVTFSVTDTGTGIPPERAETVFARFRKLDNFKQGTGLGLNICRAIAERLEGEVKLDTAYIDGARFLFIIPLQLSKEES